jgi:hypothetical protein
MDRLFKISLASLALLLQAHFAYADSVTRTVGGASFNFVPPEGQCVLEDDNAQDARFISTLRALYQGAHNTLIVATMECNRRARLRGGDTGKVLDYAAYYTPDPFISSTVPGETKSVRKDLCTEMRKQGQATLDGVKDIVAAKAKELRANIAVTSTNYIGVLDEDDHGCYAALLVGVKGAGNETVLMSSTVTATVIHSKPLFLAIYSEYKGPETTQAGVHAAKDTTVQLDSLNP